MRLLLLDANVIIALHELDAWDRITAINEVHIPSIILREAYYYYDSEGIRQDIDLTKEIGSTITEVSCTDEELAEFHNQFDNDFKHRIQIGEIEALIILQRDERYTFCTFDNAPIKVLSMLNLSDRGISVEKLLKQNGITKRLHSKHSDKFYESCLQEGLAMRLQKRGLKKKK